MIGSSDPIPCALLFVVSLTSPRLLLRLLSHSEAPFWNPRKLLWLGSLRSDSPLYFMLLGLLALCLKMTLRWEPVYRILFSKSEIRYEWETPYCSRTRDPEWLVLQWIQIYVCNRRLLLESSFLGCAPSAARLVSRNWTPKPVFLACVSSTTNACMTVASQSQFDTAWPYYRQAPCVVSSGKYFRKECHNAVKPRAFTF
jgi:hypothetical protein